MNKLTYFGGGCAVFVTLFVIAIKIDNARIGSAQTARIQECLSEKTKHQERYIEAIRSLGGDEKMLSSFEQRLREASSFSAQDEIFKELERYGATLLEKADASDPRQRRAIDEALGAVNRRVVVEERCGGEWEYTRL